jgi:hypothetical protein
MCTPPRVMSRLVYSPPPLPAHHARSH